MAKQIFICYSSRDKIYAELICSIIEKNDIDCWIAPRDIDPGKIYSEEIIKAIENRKMFGYNACFI